MGVVEDIENIFIGFINGLTHNILGLILVAAIALFLYFKYNKPKQEDENLKIFKKQWDVTTQKLRLPTPKKLALCTYTSTIEELRTSPLHHLQYQLIGEVIGMNVVGVRTSVKQLIELSKQLGEEKLKAFIEANKEVIASDKFWVVFAVKRNIGGRFLFPNISRTLLYLKPHQIIDLNSKDNIIRVRGVGITPQGYNEIINDENININSKQLLKDTEDLVFDEITIGTLGKMGTFVENATKLDSEFRKKAEMEGIAIQNPTTSQEVKT